MSLDGKFAEKFKKARLEAMLSQFDLSVKSGLCPKSIYLYETGKGIPRPKNIRILAKILKKPVSYFMEGESEGKP